MPYYMLQAAYTPEAWKAMVKSPQNRMEAIRPVVEKLGGQIEGGWLAFGEYDVLVICQLPNNVSAAAFSMAGAAGGGGQGHQTTTPGSTEGGVGGEGEGQGGRLPPPGRLQGCCQSREKED